jgi:hypothetical protein
MTSILMTDGRRLAIYIGPTTFELATERDLAIFFDFRKKGYIYIAKRRPSVIKIEVISVENDFYFNDRWSPFGYIYRGLIFLVSKALNLGDFFGHPRKALGEFFPFFCAHPFRLSLPGKSENLSLVHASLVMVG